MRLFLTLITSIFLFSSASFSATYDGDWTRWVKFNVDGQEYDLSTELGQKIMSSFKDSAKIIYNAKRCEDLVKQGYKSCSDDVFIMMLADKAVEAYLSNQSAVAKKNDPKERLKALAFNRQERKEKFATIHMGFMIHIHKQCVVSGAIKQNSKVDELVDTHKEIFEVSGVTQFISDPLDQNIRKKLWSSARLSFQDPNPISYTLNAVNKYPAYESVQNLCAQNATNLIKDLDRNISSGLIKKSKAEILSRNDAVSFFRSSAKDMIDKLNSDMSLALSSIEEKERIEEEKRQKQQDIETARKGGPSKQVAKIYNSYQMIDSACVKSNLISKGALDELEKSLGVFIDIQIKALEIPTENIESLKDASWTLGLENLKNDQGAQIVIGSYKMLEKSKAKKACWDFIKQETNNLRKAVEQLDQLQSNQKTEDTKRSF